MLIGIPKHWRFSPLLMAHLQKTPGGHLARTTGSPRHLAKCGELEPGNCECIESSAIRTRRDVSVTIGGSFSPQACNLCSGGPVTPGSCPYSDSPIGTYTLSCNDETRSPDPTIFGNSSFYVCQFSPSVPIYYWADAIIEYLSPGSGNDGISVLVRSGYYRWFGFSPIGITEVESFRDTYSFTTRDDCTSLSAGVRVWVQSSTGVNCCGISGITTAVTVL
jgi:hypothetical protein